MDIGTIVGAILFPPSLAVTLPVNLAVVTKNVDSARDEVNRYTQDRNTARGQVESVQAKAQDIEKQMKTASSDLQKEASTVQSAKNNIAMEQGVIKDLTELVAKVSESCAHAACLHNLGKVSV